MKMFGKIGGSMVCGAAMFCSGVIAGAIGWTALLIWTNNGLNGRIEEILKKGRTERN